MPPKNSVEHTLVQERRIIDALRRNRMIEVEISAMLGITRNATTMYITRMRKQKRIRVAGWVPNPKGRPAPIFALGGDPDAVHVPQKVRKPRQPDRKETNKARVLALLEKPYATSDIGPLVHLSASAVRVYLRELRQEKKIRISGWKHYGARNGLAPIYRQGDRKDAAKPARRTHSEQHRIARQDPDRLARERLMRQQRDKLKKLKSAPASWASALGV